MTSIIAVGAATLSLLLALMLSRYLEPGDAGRGRRLEQRIAPTAFLYRGEQLVDATPPARALLTRLASADRTSLLGWIEGRVPGTLSALAALPSVGRIEVDGGQGRGSARLRLTAEDLGGGMTRLTLADPMAESAGILVDSLSQSALEEEASMLRDGIDNAPMLAWRQGADGQVTWANTPYLAEAEAHSRDTGGATWPLPRLFDLPLAGILAADLAAADHPGAARSPPHRAKLEGGLRPAGTSQALRWFDCHALSSGGETLCFALPADAAVKAERNLREFVQTLTKTFADLPIGLAIFDNQRKLQLFNPALTELTTLSISFLTARPSLHTFLDRLREARMVPEPRDYRTWRKQMSTLEAAAASGHHVETWSLPGGQTYRVTGRPHPDGALAFLFEDITSEMSLTRRFRAQLTLGAMVVDALDEALGVFAPDGQMVLENEAWRRLWGGGALPLPERLRAIEAALDASGGAGARPGLARLTQHLTQDKERRPASGAMLGPHGLLGWQVTPLPGGQVMVGFSTNPARLPQAGGGEATPREALAPLGLPSTGLAEEEAAPARAAHQTNPSSASIS
ncbi:PAS-domain containing protein [Paracoccus suum]|uniref:PAS-domain containing protein n=1 Tax=Paracoccus suum TaxID=2259340 RepID=UPI0013B068DA|nr:PAS-domain containing protein [Paracoccus suum]